MEVALVSEQSSVLERELGWLSALIETSLKLYFNRECKYGDVRDLLPPDLPDSLSAYAQTVRDHALSFEERAVLALALARICVPRCLTRS